MANNENNVLSDVSPNTRRKRAHAELEKSGGNSSNDNTKTSNSKSPNDKKQEKVADKPDNDAPSSKKRKTSSSTSSANNKATKSSGQKAKSSAKDAVPDVSDIHLEGEEEDKVPVYETCDMIRRKIDQYLKKPGVTQASFCRDLQAQYHTPSGPKSITSSQLASFRGKKGYDKGNTSSVFYAAYCYFEKLRIKEGKAKSKDRQKMEELYAQQGGFNIKTTSNNKRLFMMKGEGLKYDKYGQFTIIGHNGRTQTGVF
ncbi:hypothetical protein AOQ84DRAFT_330342 [Glonium stellatum]|uniref:DUF7726 domain-containing protein n=1 Tax=Glonium stellatum TaxID=574774 RepID=A0A8E2FCX5_9PEZI|nr:hypothetical protein AOQ84DRAFT_330342 [Glonium stellatum]